MKKKNQESKNSPFWKPENPGEIIEGIFINLQATTKSNCIALALKDGTEKLVSISTVIHSFLAKKTGGKALVEKLRPNKDLIKIQFTKRIKNARIYRMWVNKIEVDQSFEAKIIKPEDVLNNPPEKLDKKK
jgi:hypothetical protein